METNSETTSQTPKENQAPDKEITRSLFKKAAELTNDDTQERLEVARGLKTHLLLIKPQPELTKEQKVIRGWTALGENDKVQAIISQSPSSELKKAA